MTICTNIEPYFASHWRNPRGCGLWAFTLHRGGSYTEFMAHGSYTEALRQAKAEAKQLGCDTVAVQP